MEKVRQLIDTMYEEASALGWIALGILLPVCIILGKFRDRSTRLMSGLGCSAFYSHDNKTSNFCDDLHERLSPLCRKGRKKGRRKSEVDAVICWLTGYNQRELEGQLKKQKDLETFFKEAPKLNPSRTLIKGVVCGVRVEDIQEPTMREIRYLDKLVDELAKGKAMDKILRT